MVKYWVYQNIKSKLHYAVDMDGPVNEPPRLLYANSNEASVYWTSGEVVTTPSLFVLVARNVVFKASLC